MDWLLQDPMAMLITGLGTLFLFGEILVNMRAIFALLGIGTMTFYFTTYAETESLTLMIIIYLIGLALIIIDGKFINDGTIGTIGIVSVLIAVALSAPNLTAGLYAVIGVLLGAGASFLLLKIFKTRKRKLWSKLTLSDRLTSEAGYSSMNEEYKALVGQEGVSLTDLRPIGTIRIEGKEYSGISNAEWIEKDTPIRVEEVDGTRILVRKINS